MSKKLALFALALAVVPAMYGMKKGPRIGLGNGIDSRLTMVQSDNLAKLSEALNNATKAAIQSKFWTGGPNKDFGAFLKSAQNLQVAVKQYVKELSGVDGQDAKELLPELNNIMELVINLAQTVKVGVNGKNMYLITSIKDEAKSLALSVEKSGASSAGPNVARANKKGKVVKGGVYEAVLGLAESVVSLTSADMGISADQIVDPTLGGTSATSKKNK